ncbi:hypothetical protein BDW22DRAFT_1430204 [Trametopsis cervina]|nr:hypothetical protein BDW22DRAFT_1430204 [Trametopsis cervina]
MSAVNLTKEFAVTQAGKRVQSTCDDALAKQGVDDGDNGLVQSILDVLDMYLLVTGVDTRDDITDYAFRTIRRLLCSCLHTKWAHERRTLVNEKLGYDAFKGHEFGLPTEMKKVWDIMCTSGINMTEFMEQGERLNNLYNELPEDVRQRIEANAATIESSAEDDQPIDVDEDDGPTDEFKGVYEGYPKYLKNTFSVDEMWHTYKDLDVWPQTGLQRRQRSKNEVMCVEYADNDNAAFCVVYDGGLNCIRCEVNGVDCSGPAPASPEPPKKRDGADAPPKRPVGRPRKNMPIKGARSVSSVPPQASTTAKPTMMPTTKPMVMPTLRMPLPSEGHVPDETVAPVLLELNEERKAVVAAIMKTSVTHVESLLAVVAQYAGGTVLGAGFRTAIQQVKAMKKMEIGIMQWNVNLLDALDNAIEEVTAASML